MNALMFTFMIPIVSLPRAYGSATVVKESRTRVG